MSTNISNNPLFIELFGTSEQEQETTAGDLKGGKRIPTPDVEKEAKQICTHYENLEGSPSNGDPDENLKRGKTEFPSNAGNFEVSTSDGGQRQEQEGLSLVKENEHDNIFSYRPEILKTKLLAFLSKLKQAGARYSVISGYSLGDSCVKIACNDSRVQEQLTSELIKDTELEALLILKSAIQDEDLADCIKGCACNSNGYSDSLFLAVLCNLKLISERASKELQPCIEWRDELKQLGII